jgi:hypothetical protein
MARRKSLLIGINYTGSQHALNGCHQDVENIAEFLSYRGYSDDPRSQVILRDDMRGQYYPSGANMLVSRYLQYNIPPSLKIPFPSHLAQIHYAPSPFAAAHKPAPSRQQ